MKKLILLLLMLPLLLVFSVKDVKAAENYEIRKYNIEINIGDDNIYHVTETIDAYFHSESHGIYRYLPLKYNVKYKDQVKQVISHVANIRVPNEKTDISNSNRNKVIVIGDEDILITGHHQYVICYDYSIGKDIFKDEDLFYYNLLSGWSTKINNITFRLTFPEKIVNEPEFSSGATYKINGRVVTGSLASLNTNEALTALFKFEEGYFKNAKSYSDFDIIAACFSIISILFIGIGWIIYGKDRKEIEVVNFYPPENLSAPRLSYYYKKTAVPNDIVMAIFNLANEGYVEISETGENKDLVITKLKEYDGDKEELRVFFEGLFLNGDVSSIASLTGKFYNTIKAVSSYLAIDKYKIMEKKSNNMTVFSFLFCLVDVAIIVYGLVEYYYLSLPLVGILTLCSIILTMLMPKRTVYGTKIYGEIKGFKNYIEYAKEEDIRARLEENDHYFYDVLPYAYIFGLDDKWMEKFEKLSIEIHDFNGINAFTYYYLFNTMSRVSAKSLISIPSSSSSGGGGSFGGGGGFSGGGFGGGGGGSW